MFYIFAAIVLLSCNKETSKKMSEVTLKAVPAAVVNNEAVTLTADQSTGAIAKYGWQLDNSSPNSAQIVYTPSSSHKGSDFVPIIANVPKTGIYVFGLTVYDAAGNQEYETVSVYVK